ncbi:FkbM family methyltransferase [Yoonia sp.]|uniref:FkbM family methyltransferase n=1 Tax=Yoonia sp. TaxID=2212373 RepID=UPI002DFCD3B3|nr:FkbM family methyltransferase [Yoonia sp.]
MQPILTRPSFRPFREGLATNRLLRTIVLPVLRKFDRAMTMTNPFSGLPFHLRSYTHKGYWFYGRHRERDTMQRLAALTQRGDIVFEVGGHIGYFAQFFAKQVGHRGQVHVFEPGEQNQHFLRRNIARCTQCVHVNVAVSDKIGKALFYEENMGGFMNSLDPDFAKSTNNATTQRSVLKLRQRRVNTTTLDAYATAHNVWPDVLKIDAEGAELAVLVGAAKVLQHVRSLMIEVSRNHDEIFDNLVDHGFSLWHPDGRRISDAAHMDGNVFATRA